MDPSSSAAEPSPTTTTMTSSNQSAQFRVIDLSMMNPRLFYPLSGLGSFTVQTMTYPLALLRTRLQLQQGSCVYRGLSHAAACVLREEGFCGLYRGYFVKSAQFFSSMLYASVYESVRHKAGNISSVTLSSTQCSFIGGATASLAAQTIIVPLDVVAQHLMVLSVAHRRLNRTTTAAAVNGPISSLSYGIQINHVRSLTPIRLTSKELDSGWSRFRGVFKYVASQHGIRGFYKGFIISLCSVVPSSALWWAFYDKFCHLLLPIITHRNLQQTTEVSPTDEITNVPVSPYISRLAVQLVSGPLAGMCAATIVNPVDCIRVRMQVGHSDFQSSIRMLWRTERFRWFTKGLSARLLQTFIFSFSLVLIYEPIKLFCLKDEYRGHFDGPLL